MDYKNMIYLDFKQLKSVEEIKQRSIDIKSHMRDCDDFTPLNILTEQAIKAAIMCDHCSKTLAVNTDTELIVDANNNYLVCISCGIVFKGFKKSAKWINKCPHCGARTLRVKGR